MCGNVKQMAVIAMSVYINNDAMTTQNATGIAIVSLGGALYTYIGYRESKK